MIERLLSRLDGVKQVGPDKWRARCPAHDDKRPSLDIKEARDGVVLLICRTGCETQSVLDAVCLQFSDLYPETNKHRIRPIKYPLKPRVNPRELLAILDHESLVVSIIGADFLEHHEIDEPTWVRLAQAVARINTARTDAVPLKVTR